MKILYSCLSKSWGGMEMYTLTSLKKLTAANVKVELLCSRHSRLHIEARNKGVIIHTVRAGGYFHPAGILKVVALLKRGGYDLIHSQYSKDLWVIIPAVKILGNNIPVILTKHLGSFIKKMDFLHSWIYNRVTKVLAISRVIKSNLLQTVPVPEEKIIILYDGTDTDKFNPAAADRKKIRDEFKINDNEILIGMLARFSPGKGHEEMIAAAEILSKEYNNLKFLVVGEASRGEDAYENKIKELVSASGLNNIIFSGFRSDTPDILAALDIFVFPSHAEAFGMALAEAMAMQIPAAASDSDGVLDLVDDGITGLLFENKNSADLAAKVKTLIDSPGLRIKFGAESRKKVLENFALDAAAEKTIKLYRELTGG